MKPKAENRCWNGQLWVECKHVTTYADLQQDKKTASKHEAKKTSTVSNRSDKDRFHILYVFGGYFCPGISCEIIFENQPRF